MREAFTNSNHNNNFNNSNSNQPNLLQQQMLHNSGNQGKQSSKKQQHLFMGSHKAAFTTDQSPQLLLKQEALSKLGPNGAHTHSNNQALHVSHIPQSSASSYFLSDPGTSGILSNPAQLTPQQIEAVKSFQFQQLQLQQQLATQREQPDAMRSNLVEINSQTAVADLLEAQQNSRQQVQQHAQIHHQKNNSMGNKYSGQLSYYGQQIGQNQIPLLSFDETTYKEKQLQE